MNYVHTATEMTWSRSQKEKNLVFFVKLVETLYLEDERVSCGLRQFSLQIKSIKYNHLLAGSTAYGTIVYQRYTFKGCHQLPKDHFQSQTTHSYRLKNLVNICFVILISLFGSIRCVSFSLAKEVGVEVVIRGVELMI